MEGPERMDHQLLELMRDRFDRVDSELTKLNDTLALHTAKDERYWTRIDTQEGQISLLKWMGSGLSISAAISWLYQKFGH